MHDNQIHEQKYEQSKIVRRITSVRKENACAQSDSIRKVLQSPDLDPNQSISSLIRDFLGSVFDVPL